MSSKRSFLALSLVSMLLFSGCLLYKPVNIGKIERMELDEFSTKAIKFKLIVPIENPNNYKFQMIDSDLEIRLNDKLLTNLAMDNDIVVPKNFNGTIEFPVSITLENLFSKGTLALMDLFKSKEVELKIDGYVKVKAAFLTKRFRVKEKNKISIFK